MADDNEILGIHATINDQDIVQGSKLFVAKVSDMERASDKLINSMGDGFNWLNSQIKSLTDSLEENRLKLQEIFFQMGSIKPSNKASQEAYNDLQQQYEKALGGQRELEEQLENVTQKMEAQKEAYQRMLSAQRGTSGISANNQVAQSLNDVKSLKEELKLVESQIKSNEKSYQENIKSLDAYEQRIMQLERLKAKGQQRVIVDKDKSLSANTSEELESQKTKYEDLRKKQGELNGEIEQQKKRQSELNVLLEQSNAKVAQFKTQLTSIKQQMMEMRKNGQDNTDEFKKLQEQASALQEVIDDTNNEIKLASSQKLGFQATKEGLTLLTGALTGATAVMSMFNSSSEDVEKMQKRLQEVMALTMAVQQLYSVTLSTSALKTYALGKAKLFLVNTTNTLRNSFVGLGLSATGASIAVTALYAALTLGISAAITAIVTAISSWIDKTDKAKKKQEEQVKLLENESAIRKQAAQSIIKQLSEYKKLQNEWKNLNGALDKQNKFIKDNEDAFSKLGVAVKNVSDAENLFVKNESAFIESIKHRALAAAAMAQIEDEYKKVIDSMIEADSYISKGGDTGTKKTAETLADEHIKALLVQNGVVNSKDNAYKYLQAIKSGKNNADLKGFDYTKEYKAYYKKQLENLSKQEALQLYDFSKIRQEAEKRINKFAGIASSESILADKLLSDNGIKKYNSTEIKYNEELDKYKILLDRQAREKKRSEEDAQLAIDEAWVSMQEDSLQKRLNILGLNYDKQMLQLERQQEDELIKLIEDERTKFEANPANKGKKFDPTGIELSSEVVAKYNAQRKQLMDSFLKENDKMSKEVEQKYQSDAQRRMEIEKKYNKDIEELNRQRMEAETRGDAERVQNLESSIRKATVEKAKSLLSFDFDLLKQSPEYVSAYEDLSNISTQTLEYLISEFEKVKASASSSLNPEDLREYTQTLQDMYDELNSRNPFKAIADTMNELNASRNTLRELRDIINGKKLASKIDDKGGKLTSIYEYTDENGEKKIITYSEALEKYGKLLDDTLKKENKAKKSVTEVSVAFSTLGSEISNLGNAIGGTAGEVVSLIGDVMTFASSTIQGIQSLSTSTAGAMAAIEKASVILSIASAALQILQKISSLGTNKAFKQYEAYAEKIKDINALTDAVNQYKYAILEARNEESNWFSVDSLRNLKDYKEMQQQALIAYQDKALESQAIYQNESGGGWLTGAFNWIMGNLSLLSPFEWWKNIWGQGNYDKGQTAAINNLRIETRKASSGFLGSGIGGKSQKTEDLQTWINQNKDKFKDLDTNLFDKETGLINKELANEIIEKYGDKLVGQTKETLEALIELKEKYDEYLEKLHEYVSSLYEPLVDNFIDSLWDWFDNGKDALKSFKDYASDTFREIVTDMMRTIVLEKVVGGFSDDIANLYEKYSVGQLSMDELMKKVSERMSGLIGDYETQIPVLQEMMNQMNGYLESVGLNMKDSSYSQEASSKGFQAMSQDVGEELNGRFTALQIAGEEIKAQNIVQSEFMKVISADTSTIKMQIAMNLRQVSEMVDIQREANDHLSQISKNTNQLYEMNERLGKIEKNTRGLS